MPVAGDFLRLHKRTGLGYVLVGGPPRQRAYCGPFFGPDGSVSASAIEAARQALSGGLVASAQPGPVTVRDLAADYLADVLRRRRDRPGQIFHYRTTVRLLVAYAGSTPAEEFGPLMLRSFRSTLVEARKATCTAEEASRGDPESARYGRKGINEHVTRVVRMFEFGASMELVSNERANQLGKVRPLERGEVVELQRDGQLVEFRLREPVGQEPAAIADVVAVLPLLSRQLQAVVRLLVFTGARPGEILNLRPCDVDRSSEPWVLVPDGHKNAWRDPRRYRRRIALPSEARGVIEPFLAGRASDEPLFSPAEAERERHEARHRARVTPGGHGNGPGRSARVRANRAAQRAPGAVYDSNGLRRAIERACISAGVPVWRPYALRKLAATIVEAAAGEEIAGAVLGHHDPVATALYHQHRMAQERARQGAEILGRAVADELGAPSE